MNERLARLQVLKKTCRQTKRKYVTLWKCLGILLLVFGVLLGTACMMLLFLGNTGVAVLIENVWNMLCKIPFLQGQPALDVCQLENLIYSFAMWVYIGTAAVWALFVLALVFWIRGVKKYKKSPGYLDYKTMKKACREIGI